MGVVQSPCCKSGPLEEAGSTSGTHLQRDDAVPVLDDSPCAADAAKGSGHDLHGAADEIAADEEAEDTHGRTGRHIDEDGEEKWNSEAEDEEDEDAPQSPRDSEPDEQNLLARNSLMEYLTGIHEKPAPKMERKRTRSSLVSDSGSAGRASTATKGRMTLVRSMGSNPGTEANCGSDYTVGDIIGEGIYGIVCGSKRMTATGQEKDFAMKMVDKVETAMVDIIKEAKFLYTLAHPNITGFHDFFDEQFFCCIVMDKYVGGTILQGMQRALKVPDGGLDSLAIHHVFGQMIKPLVFLHKRQIVHRDINADNFLIDRADILDVECKVALGDFGLAVETQPGEKIRGVVGRKLFWAPETKDNTCDMKVDIWALGVTYFGLLDGRFPFSDEFDARKAEPRFRFEVHPICRDLILKSLRKDKTKRPSAETMMTHPWIVEKPSPDDAGLDQPKKNKDEKEDAAAGKKPRLQKKPTFKRGRSNDEVSNRRKMLLDRILSAAAAGPGFNRNIQSEAVEAIRKRRRAFTVTDKTKKCTTKYEWWTQERVEKAGLLGSQSTQQATSLDDKWLHTVTLMLKQHDIDTTRFGKGSARPLSELVAEVSSGASRLMLDATKYKTLVRAVNVVLVCVRTSEQNPELVLMSKSETFSDGSKRDLNTLPGTKREPHENSEEAASRVLTLLGLNEEHLTKATSIDEFEEEEESPSYPGVMTVTTKTVFEYTLGTDDPAVLSEIGLPDATSWSRKDSSGHTRHMEWIESEKLDLGPRRRSIPEITRLVPAPIGPSLKNLKAHFEKHNLDISVATHKSLEDLYAEATKGEASLIMDSSGDITHVVDVVIFQLIDEKSKRILVETEKSFGNGTKQAITAFPSAKRRADENHFYTVWRILGEQLTLHAHMVKIDSHDVQYFEEVKESARFPGLMTVTRKRLMRGHLLESATSAP